MCYSATVTSFHCNTKSRVKLNLAKCAVSYQGHHVWNLSWASPDIPPRCQDTPDVPSAILSLVNITFCLAIFPQKCHHICLDLRCHRSISRCGSCRRTGHRGVKQSKASAPTAIVARAAYATLLPTSHVRTQKCRIRDNRVDMWCS